MQEQTLVPGDFAARVKAARAYKGRMSQAALAKKLGMSTGYVKDVEKGKGLKDLEAVALLERLPGITGLSRGFFLGESKDDAATKLDRILAILGDFKDEDDVATRLASILTVVTEMQASTKERYESLEERLGKIDPEAADEAIRLLAEARMRVGRDTERPPQSGDPSTDHLTG